MSVATSQLLYAASIWATNATKYEINRKAMSRPLISTALRITRAYSTVSHEAALFISGISPADLLALERSRKRIKQDEVENPDNIKGIRKFERKITIIQWQARWNRGENAS